MATILERLQLRLWVLAEANPPTVIQVQGLGSESRAEDERYEASQLLGKYAPRQSGYLQWHV